MSKFFKHLSIFLINAGFILANCLPLRSQSAFTKSDTISCSDSITYKNLGHPSWVIPEIIKPPQYGNAMIKTDGVYSSMQYNAPPCFRGMDTIIVLCAKATQISCDTGIYILYINCNEVADHVEVHSLRCGDSVSTYLSGFGVAQIAEGPFHGKAKLYRGFTDLDSMVYYPDSLFSGMDYIKLSLFGGILKNLIIYHVNCKLPSSAKEFHNEVLNIFPNPVIRDKLFIYGRIQTIEKLFLINSLGMPVAVPFTKSSDAILVDVGNLTNGWYSVIVQEPFKNSVKRFIIMR